MLRLITVLTLLLAIRVVAAFAVPTNDKLSGRTKESAETSSANDNSSINRAEDAGLIMNDSSQANVVARWQMRSNNLRWIFRGIFSELYHNIALRQFNRMRRIIKQDSIKNDQICRQYPRNEIAIVTGATGGIGSCIAHQLADEGYDVVVAARDAIRGKKLVDEIRERLAQTPLCKSYANDDATSFPVISFVEYHADDPQSALNLALFVEKLIQPGIDVNRRLSVLINNAGIMGRSKQLTMTVNLIGPAVLTFALLPLMSGASSEVSNENSNHCSFCGPRATVINVGSSAHLRATKVIDEEIPLGENESYIRALPNVDDKDLSTYAQSKLALMQFSTLLRRSLSESNTPIQIYDAHPGLVWTPLLRNHIGCRATDFLHQTGLAKLIYKTPEEGAQAIVAALDFSLKPSISKGKDRQQQQTYFVNGRPDGFATPESRDHVAALELLRRVIAPEVRGVMKLPDAYAL
ncbi:hypothetical protein ACHAW6_013469 [Cyclotella cf. meneghiniana]